MSTEPEATASAPTPDQIRAGVLAGMTGPGGPFELVEENVRGWSAKVFKNRPASLRDLVADAAKFGDAEFLVMPDRDLRLTFAELPDRVRAVAASLAHEHGVGHGDRVAIFAANSPEWAVTFWAATSLGAVVVAMNGWWTADESSQALANTAPKVIVGDSRRLERLDGISEVVADATIIDIDSDVFRQLWNADGTTMPMNEIGEDDPALILFTSGTTGKAKGATISHRGVVGFPQSMILGAAFRTVAASAMKGEAPRRQRWAADHDGECPAVPCLGALRPHAHESGDRRQGRLLLRPFRSREDPAADRVGEDQLLLADGGHWFTPHQPPDVQ